MGQQAKGKLGVLLPGMGAVATTFIAGVEAVRRGLAQPVGSLTQLGYLPFARRINETLPLAPLSDIGFAGWDIYDSNCYETARAAKVLERDLLDQVRPALEGVRPMPAVFSERYVKRLSGPNVKQGKTWWELAGQLKDDIASVKRDQGFERMVMVWCGSTEVYTQAGPAHQSVRAFEEALKRNDASITPSMVYAYAALTSDVAFANGAPNLTTDIPAMLELARERRVPICGKDFKTGQTLMKTVVAPALQARYLGLAGWYSTNILGNRDGEVLDDPESFKTKEVSKLSVLESILDGNLHPELYASYSHKVCINYYPPRGDNKEGWDNIDIFGWLGYPMQIKIDFLCRDSILAAPLVLDLALLLDLAQRKGKHGVQEWLGFYFKSPMVTERRQPLHDLFAQQKVLFDTLEDMAK